VSFGLTHLLALTGDLHAALARSREAVEFTLGRGEPKLTVWAALPGVAAADELALDDEALRLARIALDAANEVGADYARASTLNALGTALGGSGRAAEAEAALREAQTLLRGMGLHTAADAMLHDLAAALTAQNRDAEAAEVLRAQWRALDPHPNVMADVLGRLLLEAALLGARAGRVRAAARALPHVDVWVRDSYLRGFVPPRLRGRMELVRSLVGDPDAAEGGGVPRPADLAALLGDLLGGT
jgi:ATP/maltotriose-dependent transcriptional regulator MalT